jgi:predicted nucleic-acid-binding Zn-ribbon protein
MRTTATCPKCSGKKLFVAKLESAGSSEVGYRRGLSTFAIPAVLIKGTAVGHFESWICAACGYTELYAEDLDKVARLAEKWPDQVRIVDTTNAEGGPFR